MWTRKLLFSLICLSFLGCRSEKNSSASAVKALREVPQVVNLNPKVVVEKWEYLSPLSGKGTGVAEWWLASWYDFCNC